MGLLDQVIGSVTGGGAGQPAGASGGMSPLTKALLALLAAKAASSYFGRKDEPAAAPAGPSGTAHAPASSGKIESGILAGLPSLDSLLGRFHASGHGETVESWVKPGPNKELSGHDLERTLGPETIAALEKQSGLPRDQLLQQLSKALPQVVDKLTPNGRLPTEAERATW